MSSISAEASLENEIVTTEKSHISDLWKKEGEIYLG